MNQKRKALWNSAVALLLCFSMLLGTTWAWFTDSVTSSANRISTGTLNVELYHTNAAGANRTRVTNETKDLFRVDLWEPGVAAYENFTVANEGSLWLKYQLGLNALDVNYVQDGANQFRLSDALVAGVVPGGIQDSNTDGTISREETVGQVTQWKKLNEVREEGFLAPEGELSSTADYGVVIWWQPTGSDNNWNVNNGKSTSDGNPLNVDLGVTLSATQHTNEEDSFGSDYDTNSEFPELDLPVKVTVAVPNDGSATTEDVTMVGRDVSATVPAGVKLANGAQALTLTVTEMEQSQANVTTGATEDMVSLDVHIDGVDANNDKAIIVDLGPVMPKYLNMGNYQLYHVENGVTTQMTKVDTLAEVDEHNEFYYDLNTGNLTVAMATFSEVAMVANTENVWKGEFDYTWYNASKTELNIANADQLAAFGAIVGGMASGIEADSFKDDTVKLIADINLGDKESENNPDLIFYPIGYYNNTGSYKKTSGGSVSSSVSSFEGDFDGQGHTIANFYQNTWEMFGDYNDGYSGTPNHYKDAMGLFGYVLNGTVKNLTVSNFSSDGEFTPTGVIAAYADGNSTFENIALAACNPRVYNTGNGGIIGIAGDTSAANDDHITLKNITVDNSNKISALWGSYDVACGGLVGMYRGNVDGSGNATGDTISFENCHVSAIIDVYNDVCANYQYYAYRYAGMIIGSVRHNAKNAEGKTIPNMTGISATGCTVNYGDWNDYYYCEFEKNTMASYSEDYQFSRVPHSELKFTDSNGNGVVDADERATVTGCKHTHTAEENHQAIYLPFHQLFTGYGWGVNSVGLEKYSGITTNLDITEGDQEESVEKFETKFTGDFLYRVGNQNTVSLGSLFAAKDGVTINNSGVWATIEKVDENAKVSGTFTANTTDWTKGTIQFSGTGVVKVTIQDYNFCTPTVLYLEVVDAVNATTATSATENNVVLLNDIGSGFTVSGRYAVYGNGFTLNYTGNGQYLNNGLKQGIVTVSGNGTLDNLRIKATIYPASYLYYNEVKNGPSTVDGDKTRYHYQLSAVAASDNATISNCYIYGGRNNIFVNTGDVTVKDTVLECGALANVQIQSNSSHTVTFNNVTTIQQQVNATIGDTSKVMLGAGIVVGPETTDNPTLVLEGKFKQYNWVNADDSTAVSNDTAKAIINAAVGATDFNHTVNGKTSSNLGVIYLNTFEQAPVTNNTGLPYEFGDITVKISGIEVKGKVYSLKKATNDQINSDVENADRDTENGVYQPQFKYSADLGGQLVEDNGGDEFCYRAGDTVYVLFPTGDTKELDLAALVSITKYSELKPTITCKDENGNAVTVTNGTVRLSASGKYTVTYTVTDDSATYRWNVTVDVALKDTAVPNARFEFDATKQKMGYYKPSLGDVKQYLPFLAGLKIYDYDYNYNEKTEYLRFDGSSDFNKVASVTITGYASNKAAVEVKLTDGGVINTQFLARANSGGGSTYTGKIKTSNNTIYFVTDSGTSNKDATTTAAYWYVDYYKFTGNNGVAIQAAQQTFNSTGSSASTPSGSFSTTIKYTVTYNANEGNCGQTTGYATSASTAVTLPTPTRSGYIFAGWYTAASGGTRVGGAGDSYTPSANITLYAQWGKPCTVTYNANGGNCATTSEKYTGTALTLPTPTRDGYWFVGWYDAASGGNKIGDAGAKYNPTKEIALYAHWQAAIKYTVTYNANGGTCSSASATYEGTALTLPTPTRTGYKFLGWYTAASGGTKIGDAGATYIPSANVTLYAQWEKIAYNITTSTTNATIDDVGQTAYYKDTVSVTVSFTQSNNKTLTVKDASGNTILSKSAAGTYTFTMPASDVTSASSEKSCVTGDTLVALADGTQKRIDEVTYEDTLLVWDFFNGCYAEVPSAIIFYHGDDVYRVLTLRFADGTEVRTIQVHGFFDVEANEFVFINEENVDNYLGHSFVKVAGDSYEAVELVGYEVTEEFTGCYSIQSACYINFMTEDMFSLTIPPIEGWFNYFEIGNDMKYDAEKMQADIEKYGLHTYEEFAEYVTYEQFIAFNGPYLKVLVGRGVLTFDQILSLIAEFVSG